MQTDVLSLAAGRGQLLMTSHPVGDFKPLLPKDPDFKDCQQAGGEIQCFKAGQSQLTLAVESLGASLSSYTNGLCVLQMYNLLIIAVT